VADIHRTLPVYKRTLARLIDARQGFLAPGRVMVPRLERIWTAAISLPRALYAEEVAGWHYDHWGVDLSAEAGLALTRNSR